MAIKTPDKYKIWIDARNKFKLRHKHIQMARELGMNPKKFGSLANHKQQPWKAPLSEFIENCYVKRFNKSTPENIITIEKLVKSKQQKKRRIKPSAIIGDNC